MLRVKRMNTPKTLAKIGSVYIEEAILAVLEEEAGLRPEEISERLGIPTETDGILRLANPVVLGFLTKLKLEGRVQDTDELPNVAGRWSLPAPRLDSDEELDINDNPQNALETLKQAVLQALYEQHASGEHPYLGFNDIHEVLSIERIPNTNDYFVHGILLRLLDDGHAEWLGERGLWQITEAGISVIEG